MALEAFGGEPFLFVPNNKRKSSAIDGLRTARKIPVVSHGLENAYADYHNIYISAALNREPRHFAMLAELGLAADYVHRASAHETYYQDVMRTWLRIRIPQPRSMPYCRMSRRRGGRPTHGREGGGAARGASGPAT